MSPDTPEALGRERALYDDAAAQFGGAIDRLVRSYERDPERQRDLRQEIHLALWRSLARFDGRCSLRTWTFRVAHNVGATFILRQRRARTSTLISLEELDDIAEPNPAEEALDRGLLVQRLYALIERLAPSDRELVLLYLEGFDATAIAEVTGLSASNVATKIHRIKHVIARQARRAESDR
jgi:RNA polymerase sigma-70 factor (ECF subfamily)